ncbi:hypothetical protein [Metabacillus fastidiosus]|uniref:hypothetical protein n=1 Tax=Metabacillus fastidiosus TaxID=1458 RepID=UPI003D2E1531
MKINTRLFLSIGILSLVITIFLIGSESYFTRQEIRALNDGCHKVGGNPILEVEGFLGLNYYFSCEK